MPLKNNKEDSDQTNNNNNNQFHPIPEWLNKDYIENILKSYKNDDSIKIISIKLTPATGKGENYASVMTRCKLIYMNNKNSNPKNELILIIKTAVQGNEFILEKMKDYDIFNREMIIYEKIVPKINSLLKEINDNEKLFANVIFVDYKNIAMIFEDLTEKLYKVIDRLSGLDMEHTKLSLKKLAKMHATTAVLNDRYPGIFQTYNRGFYNHYTNAYSSYFVNTMDACGQMVNKLDNGDYQIYGNKILKLLPNIMEYGVKLFEPQNNEFNALCHGDLWITNLMFNYNNINNNNNPKDVILIDFQYSVWTSPAIDLQYFFNTSLKEELRLNCQDELIQYYYNILSDTLKALQFKGKIPSLHEFWIQFQKKGFFGVLSTCVNQAVALNEDSSNADIESLIGENERAWAFKHSIFQNERVRQNMRTLLPIFDRKGLLDIH